MIFQNRGRSKAERRAVKILGADACRKVKSFRRRRKTDRQYLGERLVFDIKETEPRPPGRGRLQRGERKIKTVKSEGGNDKKRQSVLRRMPDVAKYRESGNLKRVKLGNGLKTVDLDRLFWYNQ